MKPGLCCNKPETAGRSQVGGVRKPAAVMPRVPLIRALITLILAAGVLLSSCAPARPALIKIGLNVEISGQVSSAGISSQNAADLAVDEINQAGGLDVGGKRYQVELVISDNQDDSGLAEAITKGLITRDVLAMIGPNLSRNAIPAARAAESGRLLMISPSSTNPVITLDPASGSSRSYVFRVCMTDQFQGRALARFAINELKTTRPAVLYDFASEYNRGLAEIFRQALEENGVRLAAFETYSTGDRDFTVQMKRIVDAGADTLFLPNYYSEIPQQVRQARKAGFTGAFLGADAWESTELLRNCGPDCNGSFFTTHYAPEIAGEKANRFITAYRDRFGETPDDIAALTYDAFGILFQAVQAAEATDRQRVRDALASITLYEGVTGNMRFQGSGDPVKTATILQVQGGRFRYYQNANP